jgi:hypothetical protein
MFMHQRQVPSRVDNPKPSTTKDGYADDRTPHTIAEYLGTL